MLVNPTSPGMPLNYYSNLYRVNQIPLENLPVKKTTESPVSPYLSDLENLKNEFLPSKLLAHLYNHFYPKFFEPSKYIIHHMDGKKHKSSSFLSMFNPFACETDESSGEGDMYGD